MYPFSIKNFSHKVKILILTNKCMINTLIWDFICKMMSWNNRRPRYRRRCNNTPEIHSWQTDTRFPRGSSPSRARSGSKMRYAQRKHLAVNSIAYARIPVVHVHEITLYTSRATRDYVARHSHELRRPWNSGSEFAASRSGVATQGTATLIFYLPRNQASRTINTTKLSCGILREYSLQ